MQCGELREIIKIYNVATERDEVGADIEVRTLQGQARAKLVIKGGNRAVVNDEVIYSYVVEFVVRVSVAVCETDILSHGGKLYRITSILPEYTDRQYKRITAEVIDE